MLAHAFMRNLSLRGLKAQALDRNACDITSDADVRVEREYLRRMVQYLRDPEVGLASCVYLGTPHPGAGLSSRRVWLSYALAYALGAPLASFWRASRRMRR